MAINLILGLFLTFLSGYYGTQYVGFKDSVTVSLSHFSHLLFHIFQPMIAGVLFSLLYIIVEVILLILYDYKLNKKMATQARRVPVAVNIEPTSTTTIIGTTSNTEEDEEKERGKVELLESEISLGESLRKRR